MAGVVFDPNNTDIKELKGQAMRAFVIEDFNTAVQAYSRLSELLVAEHGDDRHDTLGEIYLYYGKSLLHLSRRESEPLGDGVLKNLPEESEDDDDDDETNPEEDATPNPDEQVNAKNGDDTKPQSEAGASNTEETEKKTDDDDLSDLQVAWEVLELAKQIFTKRGDGGRKNLADTLITLGEVSLESENLDAAIADMLQGLEIQKTLYGNDSRSIAETHYKLGTAYSVFAQIENAVKHYKSCIEYLNNKLATLEETPVQNEDEIEEIKALIPEVEEKITDMNNLKEELANKVSTSMQDDTNGTANKAADANAEKTVNDISHLVKRKRRVDEEQDNVELPAKKISL